ncbi:MAG: molybdenum ABC transporter ATP-binding protein [Gemmatimonadetes bacterium]|nr:MAG: molybdenum ABC transporter ATP-binding protein [Gemmatimonadota bacterium]
MTGAPLIELRNVTVVRDLDRSGRPALDDVSLSLDAREHICILGPNGCGKSTLIKTITRECYPLARPGSSVRILGRDRWNVFELRERLGIVTPDLLAACSTDATGRDVVLSGFFSSTRIFRHHAPDAAQAARADALLARFGISHLADVAVSHMSSGEAKRVLIARALVHDPESLLFDEPGNALDIAAHAALVDTMSQLARAGIGVVLVTHHVSEIIPEIERVVLLREGRVFGDGPKREMLTSERLSALFGIDVDVRRDGERYSVEPRPRTDTIDRGSS